MRLWSDEHVAALLVTAAAAALAVAGARRLGEERTAGARRALALVIATGFAAEQLTYALRGTWSVKVNLPFQLSDAVTFVAIAALWRPDVALLVELVYFWALSASLQAVITPDLDDTFPDVLYFTYFATHTGAVTAACLLVFGLGRLPRRGAVPRVYAVTLGFTAVAGLVTVLTGGNYMFLRHKPQEGSLLDVLGPWPVYILGAAAIGLAMLVALAALSRTARPRAR